MSFHSQWQSGQLLSRATTDLSRDPPVQRLRAALPGRQHPPGHRGHRCAAAHVLAARPGRRRRGGPDRLAVDALREGLRRRLPPGPGRAGRPRHPGRGGRGRHPRDQVVRPQPATSPSSTTPPRASCYDTGDGQGPAVGEVLDLPRGDPQPRRRRRAAARRDRRRPRRPDARRAGRVHHPDAVAGLAGRVARRDPGDGPGGDDRRRPGPRDLRHRARHRLRREPTPPPAARPPALRARRLRLPRAPTSSVLRDVNLDIAPGRDGRAGRRHRLRQDHADRAGARGCTTSPAAGSPSTASTSATSRCRACARWSRRRSRSRRCSR